MPFQKGNKLGAKSRLFGHELEKAIAQGDPERLRRIAEKLLTMAENGDLRAIQELADRLDGKSVQTVYGEFDHTVDVGSGESFADKIERALAARAPVTV